MGGMVVVGSSFGQLKEPSPLGTIRWILAQMSYQFHFLHFICQYKNTQIFTTNKYAGTQ
jgi:hypothetical protein